MGGWQEGGRENGKEGTAGGRAWPHLHCASILVGISSPVEQPLNGELHLPPAVLQGPAWRERDTLVISLHIYTECMYCAWLLWAHNKVHNTKYCTMYM